MTEHDLLTGHKLPVLSLELLHHGRLRLRRRRQAGTRTRVLRLLLVRRQLPLGGLERVMLVTPVTRRVMVVMVAATATSTVPAVAAKAGLGRRAGLAAVIVATSTGGHPGVSRYRRIFNFSVVSLGN